MRVLIFTESINKDKKEMSFLEENLQVKIDFLDNLDEADYYAYIRHYDIIYIEYMKEYHKKHHLSFQTLISLLFLFFRILTE